MQCRSGRRRDSKVGYVFWRFQGGTQKVSYAQHTLVTAALSLAQEGIEYQPMGHGHKCTVGVISGNSKQEAVLEPKEKYFSACLPKKCCVSFWKPFLTVC